MPVKTLVATLVVVGIVSYFGHTACAQPNQVETGSGDAGDLSEQETRLLSEIQQFQAEIEVLEQTSRECTNKTAQITESQAELDEQLGSAEPDEELIDELRDDIDLWSRETAELGCDRISVQLAQSSRSLVDTNSQLANVRNEIQALISPELRIGTLELEKQKFKEKISLYCAILIGFVIVGFFVIACRDKRVRRAIFSGHSGIQFVTLFSLVIAIVLFGITGILGETELSALLGGISGFILGKVGSGGDSAGDKRTNQAGSGKRQPKPPPSDNTEKSGES